MFSLPGLVGLGLAFDRRWSAVPVILQAQGFSIALILVAAARAWNEFKPDAGKWVFVGGLIAMLVAIVGFSLWMRASARPNVRAT
jgi:hypothetical protein